MSYRWAIDGVWDIECAGWDRFLCGALWTPARGMEVFRTAEGLADALMSQKPGAQLWAHAGGKYDVLWLIDHLTRHGHKDKANALVSMSGASATSVKFKKGPWLRDSARLIPMSLARAAKIAGKDREKGDPGIPFDRLNEDMTPEEWRRVMDYCASDVLLLRDILRTIEGYAALQGIELRGTIGGTAWATAVKWCALDDADWQWSLFEFVRDSYMGGLCSVGKTKTEKRVHRFDRKSAYPASLMQPVPVGDAELVDGDAASAAFASGMPGSYRVQVTLPESYAPPLPYRYRGRLTYPYGTIAGTWPLVELKYAVEHCGATIEKVRKAVVWREESPILAVFSEKCFALRNSLPEEWQKKAIGVWLKYLANSLTGKLGQSPDFKIVAIGDYSDDPRYELVGASPWVWARTQKRIPDCGHVHMAATLTARARVELHQQITHAGHDWVYSDTDSCYATRFLDRNLGSLTRWKRDHDEAATPPEELEDELGTFAYEGAGDDWTCEAPKVYAYRDPKKGEWLAHAKGVPSTDGEHVDIELYRTYTKGKPVTNDRGVMSLLIAARQEEGGLFQRRKLTRSLKRNAQWVGARLRCKGGETMAPHVTALARL